MKFQDGGVNTHDRARATEGYTLFAPVRHDKAYLINNDGHVVNQWQLGRGGINRCQLTESGNLLVNEGSEDGPPLYAGKAGYLREYDWDGNLVWEHHDQYHHHDGRRLSNGNSMYIAWDPFDDALAARVRGGLPGTEKDGVIYGDLIKEITPDGELVWQWGTREMEIEKYPICPLCPRAEFAHANTCSPMPNGDIMVSFRVLNLLIVIDKETREISWEYQDLSLGHQHDCHILPNGNVLVFANGFHGQDVNMFSTVREINFETKETVWEFRADPVTSFFSANISGAQRLWNGNTLICEGNKGCLFEVTPEGEIVWEYVNPYLSAHPAFGTTNWIFRAFRYAPGAPELSGRL